MWRQHPAKLGVDLQQGVLGQSSGRTGEVQLHRVWPGLVVQLTRKSINRIPAFDLAVILAGDTSHGLAPTVMRPVLHRPPAASPCTQAPDYAGDVKGF